MKKKKEFTALKETLKGEQSPLPIPEGNFVEADATNRCIETSGEPGTVKNVIPTTSNSNCFNKWSKVGEAIIAANDTFDKLEPGYYNVDFSQNLGLFFVKLNISSNKIYRLPNKACDIIMDDISKFWTLQDQYKKYNRVFRRNYLLYSAPGTGKTSLIRLMCKELIEKYEGIVFSLSDIRRELELVVDGITRVRNIEPDKKIIVVMEDIDTCITSNENMNRSSNETETLLLNMLDGFYQFDNVVVIATTNYIENIPPRFKNRPSRFSRVIEFPLPNEACRRMFLEKTISSDDISTIDVDKWVKKTEGYTIDHLNEVILLHFVFGETEDYAFEHVDKMVKENSKLKNVTSVNKKQSMGFVVEEKEEEDCCVGECVDEPVPLYYHRGKKS